MSKLTLIVGNKNYSSWSLRPYLALKQTGAEFAEVVIPLRQPDTAGRIAERTPAGRVPALQDGDLTIWDSLAIVEYLAERFPAARLWPDDREARAVARAVSAEMHSGFVALREAMPMNIRATRPPRPISDDVRVAIDRIKTLWRDTRRRFGSSGPFLFGAFTNADAMYAPVVTRFRTYGVALDGVEAAYADAVWSLPAMQEWITAASAEPWGLPSTDDI